jgi:hypothetical protein
VLTSDEDHIHVSDIPIAPTVAGPQGTGFIPVGILERMSVQESPNTTQELKHVLQNGVATINQYHLRLDFDNCVKPLKQILANEAGHLQGVVCQISK